MEAREIARRLIDLAATVEPIEVQVGEPADGEGEIRSITRDMPQHPLMHLATELMYNLEAALCNESWSTDSSELDQLDGGRWTFGSSVTLVGRKLDILRGFIVPARTVPILDRVPDHIALYLMTIEGGEDLLKREAHSGVGWHYHYLDKNQHRSDVILCWDTRWAEPNQQTAPASARGLFVEKHAEAGKPFRAKPSTWGAKKRESMYCACKTDLAARDIKEYRCAANKAEVVYPPTATLTPHPLAISAVKGRKRRR